MSNPYSSQDVKDIIQKLYSSLEFFIKICDSISTDRLELKRVKRKKPTFFFESYLKARNNDPFPANDQIKKIIDEKRSEYGRDMKIKIKDIWPKQLKISTEGMIENGIIIEIDHSNEALLEILIAKRRFFKINFRLINKPIAQSLF